MCRIIFNIMYNIGIILLLHNFSRSTLFDSIKKKRKGKHIVYYTTLYTQYTHYIWIEETRF